MELGDNDKVMLGNSNDLQIYHDSIGSIIQNNTGPTIIRGAGSNVDIRNSNDEIMIRCNGGSSVDIRHGNSKKFETTSSGVGITGNLEVGSGQITCGVHGTTGMQIINNGVFGTLHSANLTFRTVSSTRMVIDTNGNIGAPSGSNIYNASDKRLKKNIVDIDKGLSVVKALRPVSFNWIDGFCDEEKQTLYGFIAQEVQTVDSNLINQFGSDGVVIVDGVEIENTLRVNDKFITPILVKAVQEAIARIEALETEVAALKAA